MPPFFNLKDSVLQYICILNNGCLLLSELYFERDEKKTHINIMHPDFTCIHSG